MSATDGGSYSGEAPYQAMVCPPESATFRTEVRAVRRRQKLLRRLVDWRRAVATQEVVAAVMRTSQPAIARLERGGADPRLSTVERLAAAVGARISWDLEVDEDAVKDSPHLDMTRVRAAMGSTLRSDELDAIDRLCRQRLTVDPLLRACEEKEREAARAAASSRTESDLTRLRAALEVLPEIPEKGFRTEEELTRFRAADREFHLAVAAATHDEGLCQEVERLRDRVSTFLADGALPCPRGIQRRLHGDILEAITAGDGDRAGAAMAEHARMAREVMDEMLMGRLRREAEVVEAVLDVRERTECLAARLAAERSTDEDRRRLVEALRALPEVPDEGFADAAQATAFRDADRALHLAIAAAAQQPVLCEIATVAHCGFLDLITGVQVELQLRPAQARQHRAIVEAICEGRPEEAARTMGQLIGSTREVLRPALEDWIRKLMPSATEPTSQVGAGR